MSLLQILFYLSSPLWYTVQSGILRSAPSSHDPSSNGGAREPSRTCAFRERKQDSAVFPAPLPPLRPAPPPFPPLGHPTRRFWKVSLKARGGEHDRTGAQRVLSAGNRTQRQAGRPPRMRGVGCWPTDRGVQRPQSVWMVSQRCTSWTCRGRGWGREDKGEGGGFRELVRPLDSGWRTGAQEPGLTGL